MVWIFESMSNAEFEGYYWAEAKKRLQQKKQENLRLVS